MKINLTYLEIETCSMCNRTCPWCLFGQIPDFRGSEQRFLDTAYIEKVLVELKHNEYKGIIAFHSMNEPLMDERITDGTIFQLCRKILGFNDVKIRVNTNGVLLSNEIITKMLSSGLERIYISCYDGSMLDKALTLKGKYEEIVVLDFTGERASLLKYNRAGSIKSEYEPERSSAAKTCKFPIFSSVVGFDGEIRLCCDDPLRQIELGNIKNENLYDVLNSKRACELRNKIVIDRNSVFPCNVCNFTETSNYSFDFDRASDR